MPEIRTVVEVSSRARDLRPILDQIATHIDRALDDPATNCAVTLDDLAAALWVLARGGSDDDVSTILGLPRVHVITCRYCGGTGGTRHVCRACLGQGSTTRR